MNMSCKGLSGLLALHASIADLEQTMMGAVTFDEQIKAGKAKLEGDREPYELLKTMLVQFDLGFEMMPGTGSQDLTPPQNPLQQEAPADSSGG